MRVISNTALVALIFGGAVLSSCVHYAARGWHWGLEVVDHDIDAGGHPFRSFDYWQVAREIGKVLTEHGYAVKSSVISPAEGRIDLDALEDNEERQFCAGEVNHPVRVKLRTDGCGLLFSDRRHPCRIVVGATVTLHAPERMSNDAGPREEDGGVVEDGEVKKVERIEALRKESAEAVDAIVAVVLVEAAAARERSDSHFVSPYRSGIAAETAPTETPTPAPATQPQPKK